MAARIDRPPRVGQPAAGRRDADEQRVGRARQRKRLVERRDDRDVVAGRYSSTLRPAFVESMTATTSSCPYRMTPNAVLPLCGRELALGEDDEAAMVGRTHPAECTDSPDAEMRPCAGWIASERLRRRRGMETLVRAVDAPNPDGRRRPARRGHRHVVDRRRLGDRRLYRPPGPPDIDVAFRRDDLPAILAGLVLDGLRLVQRERHAPAADDGRGAAP